ILIAVFFVEVAADRLGGKGTQQARFLPGLLQGNFAGGLARPPAPLRNNPPFSPSGGDQANPTSLYLNLRGLSSPLRRGCHQLPPGEGGSENRTSIKML